MPSTTEAPFTGYAHCNSPRCPGHNQEKVEGVRVETFHTFVERGGDLPGIESSQVSLRFADEDVRACPHCGRNREITDQTRKRYAPLSGHSQDGLLGAPPFDPAKLQEQRQKPMTNEEREQMEAQLREQTELNLQMQERLAALEAKDGDKAPA